MGEPGRHRSMEGGGSYETPYRTETSTLTQKATTETGQKQGKARQCGIWQRPSPHPNPTRERGTAASQPDASARDRRIPTRRVSEGPTEIKS